MDKKSDFSYVLEFSKQFKLEMNEKSDRAIVLISAIYLENALTEVLKKYLMSNNLDKKDNLFDGNRPIYFFGPKIDLAQRAGLISVKLWSDLNYIRKMRDDVAHKIKYYKLNTDKVNHLSEKFIHYLPSYRKQYFPEGIQGNFLMVVDLLLLYLEVLKEELASRKLEEEFKEKIPAMKSVFDVISQFISSIDSPKDEWIYLPEKLKRMEKYFQKQESAENKIVKSKHTTKDSKEDSISNSYDPT